jgi:amphi-Trp domain-containing protein
MAEVPESTETEPDTRTITDGFFEEELYVDADAAGAFLQELGRQLQEGSEVTITGDDWELPFAFAEPIELDIEFQGDGEPELEVELEIEGTRNQDEVPGVE